MTKIFKHGEMKRTSAQREKTAFLEESLLAVLEKRLENLSLPMNDTRHACFVILLPLT